MQDYATYKINANLKMKELSKELVRDELAQAALSVDEVIVELRLMKAAITDLMERRDASQG
jgi:hypothetical protein